MTGIMLHLRRLTAILVAMFIYAGVGLVGGGIVTVALPIGEAQAQSGTVISQVVVRGNRRVESAAIRSHMTLNAGDRYSEFQANRSFKALFATGLFSSVTIKLAGRDLMVTVVENPIINRVAFEGNKKITDETLEREVESHPRMALTSATVQSDVRRVLTLYRRKGRFGATVEPKIIQLPQNRVDLVFEIKEGDKTGVTRISFIGNRAFSDKKLRDVISTGETGYLSFFRSNDVYDPDRLAADQELLRRHYLSNGYADFQVVSAVADLDEQRNAFYITITVDEGPLYTFGTVQIESNIASLDPDVLRDTVNTLEGDVYDSELIERTLEDLTLEVSRHGHAFAQVTPRGKRDTATRTISVTYVISQGARTYVERIEIEGNTRTQDHVIRREFDIVEGDPYNRVLVERAERRLNGLGFFEKVTVNSRTGSARDRVIILVNVEEKPTGSFSAGVGYSSSDGILGDVSISERNFLGRGQFVRLALAGSSKRTDIDFSFTEPYFQGRRLSAGFDIFSRELDLVSESSFTSEKVGGGIRLGFYITPETSFTTRYVFSREKTVIGATTTTVSPAILSEAGKETVSVLGYTLRYDTIDDKKNPTNGVFATLSQDVAGLGGSVSYLRTSAEARVYHNFYKDFVGVLRLEAGHITGLGDNVRVSDAFLKGGETVRGFSRGGFGPRDAVTGDLLGGKTYLAASAEVQFPFFGLPEHLGFRGAVFADVGTTFGSDAKGRMFDTNGDGILDAGPITVADSSSLRSSVGASILWNSPFGPLRVDFAHVLSKQAFDDTESIRFGAGAQF